ncbi:unnamed protein product [Aureobasidium vineae]|uniref:Cryptic loci regulator 2 N-terminal domain-containing protein n=1 Tax=Aureobasidium vineae TaxID=2773715 RepID=A0A9N8PF76_9PEZI|nr:unnamed protein product [Aureobasidium vineae]
MVDPDPSMWRNPTNPKISTPRPASRPTTKGINPGHQNFDLSDEQFTSDGAGNWPTNKTRVQDEEFLKKLTSAYNARKDLVDQWSEPSKGYALFRQSDLTVHGHPSGRSFRSVKLFVDHVHSIMTETVASCRCVVCHPT